MKRQQKLLEQWNNYSQQVLPKECSNAQKQETRRAFYAGAQAFFDIMLKYLQDTGNPDDVTSADLSLLDDVNFELTSFNQNVKGGRA